MEQHVILAPELPRPRLVTARARVRESNPLWLWVVVIAATFGPLFFLLRSTPGGIPDDVRFLGGVLWVLALVPAHVFLATSPSRRTPTPAMPLLGLMFAL